MGRENILLQPTWLCASLRVALGELEVQKVSERVVDPSYKERYN